MQKGKDLKATLRQSKKFSAGVVFKFGSIRLGKMTFDIHRENMDEKVKKAKDKLRMKEQIHKMNVQKVKEVFDKNISIEKMTIKQLTIIYKEYKRKEDGKMPNIKERLIQKYKEWPARPAPTFDAVDEDLTLTIDTGIDKEMNTNDNNNDDVVLVAL